MSVDSNILGSGEGAAKIKVGEVKRAEESIRRDDRVEEKVDSGKRSDEGGRWDGGLEAVATGRAAHASVDPRRKAAKRAGEEEGGREPLFFCDGVVISRWG
jgi:hypothetical protein